MKKLKPFITAVLIIITSTVSAQDKGEAELFVQTGHSGLLYSFEVTPDGSFLLTSGANGMIKKWDFATGRELETFKGQQGNISSLDISPDGETMITAGKDDNIWIRDVKTGKKLKVISTSGPEISSVGNLSFSHNGKYIGAYRWHFQGAYDRSTVIWDVEAGKQKRLYNNVEFVGFLPHSAGKYIVGEYFDDSDKDLIIIDITTNKIVQRYNFFELGPSRTQLSNNGRYILTVDHNRVFRLIDFETQKVVHQLQLSDQPKGLFFSPDDEKYYVVTESGIQVFSVLDGDKVEVYQGGEWNDKDWGYANKLIGHSVFDQVWERRGSDLYLRNLQTGALIKQFSGLTSTNRDLVISPNQRLGAFVSNSRNIQVLDLQTGRTIHVLKIRSKYVSSLAFSPDGTRLLSGDTDSRLIFWDMNTGERIKILEGHDAEIVEVKFSADGRRAYSSSKDNTFRVWDIDTGSELQKINAFNNYNYVMTITPDDKYLVANFSKDNAEDVIQVWNIDKGTKVRTLRLHENQYFNVYHLNFSPDGRDLLISDLRKFRLIDFRSGKVKWISKNPKVGAQVIGSSFQNDGMALALHFDDFENPLELLIRVISSKTGRTLKTLKGHTDGVKTITYSSDGDRLHSTGRDGKVIVWNSDSGKQLLRHYSFANDEWITMTPEGYYEASEYGSQYLNVRLGREVYPIDNFFDTYYRPDIVKAVLSGRDASQLTETDIREGVELPPMVRFTSPTNGMKASKKSVILTAEITDRGGGIDEVRLFHNGKLIEGGTRGLKLSSGNGFITREFEVNLLPGENKFELTALSTGQRIESNPAKLTIDYKGMVATSDLYILAVGLNEYKNNSLNLNYGRPDAEAFVNSVKKRSAGIFKSVNVETLYDGQATRSGIKAAFEDIISKAKPQDTFLLFYAGHGVMSESEGRMKADFYMALHEATQLYGNNDGLATHGISAAEMTELTRRIAARKQMIVLDACQSGGAVETFAMRGAAEQKAIIQLARSAGLVVMASTGTEQYATEFDALGHGVFTYALLNGLEGQADGGSKDGKITVKELEAFINDRVPALTQKHRGQSQYPNSYARGQDFPIGVIK